MDSFSRRSGERRKGLRNTLFKESAVSDPNGKKLLVAVEFEFGAAVRRTGLLNDKQLHPRRESKLFEALDVIAGGTWAVRIWDKDIVRRAGITCGRGLEAAFCTKEVLANPSRVFQGIREEGEDEWLCYCGIPKKAYHPDGTPKGPREDQVFLVCVNCDRVAYNWMWCDCDPDNTTVPVKATTRFLRQVFPNEQYFRN